MDLSGLQFEETSCGIKVMYNDSIGEYVGHYPLNKTIPNRIAYLQAKLMNTRATVEGTLYCKTICIYNERNVVVKRVNLYLQRLATVYRGYPKRADKKQIVYEYGRFTSTVQVGGITDMIRSHIKAHIGSEYKDELSLDWKGGWVHALNMINFFAFFDTHRDAVAWIRSAFESKGLTYIAEKSFVQTLCRGDTNILCRFTMTFKGKPFAGQSHGHWLDCDDDSDDLATPVQLSRYD